MESKKKVSHRSFGKSRMVLRKTTDKKNSNKQPEQDTSPRPPSLPPLMDSSYLDELKKVEMAATRSKEIHVYDNNLPEEDADIYQPLIPKRNYDESDCEGLGVNIFQPSTHTHAEVNAWEEDDIYQPIIPERHYDESDCEGLGVNISQPSSSSIDKEKTGSIKGGDIYMTLSNRDKGEAHGTHLDHDYVPMASAIECGSKSEAIFNSIMDERRKVKTNNNTKEERHRIPCMAEFKRDIEQTSSSSKHHNLYVYK